MMPMNFINRFGLRLMRFGMKLARIDYADVMRRTPNGHISTGVWRS